ncbi:MAG: hypothetical protein ACFCVG_04170 [Kineosporiaceae bacterium]
MTDPTPEKVVRPSLRRGIVLRAGEDSVMIIGEGRRSSVGYATFFPTPRTERVSPGHLVAVAAAPDGTSVVVWRWFDAVVLGEERGLFRLWEPAHGEVTAQARPARRPRVPGGRAYLSAGFPGAEWWVAGAVTGRAEDADVELDEVERFCTHHDLWNRLV